MAFNQLVVKSASTGASVAYLAPLTAYKGSSIALNAVVAGTTVSTAGLVIPVASPAWNIEWDSLAAVVQTQLTTATITAQTIWQVSNDGTNWINMLGLNGAANVTVAPAGSGSAINTTYVQAFPGVNPGFPYIRMAVLSGVANGGAADAVIVAYNFRKRWTGA